jgi:hypothetical protein
MKREHLNNIQYKLSDHLKRSIVMQNMNISHILLSRLYYLTNDFTYQIITNMSSFKNEK